MVAARSTTALLLVAGVSLAALASCGNVLGIGNGVLDPQLDAAPGASVDAAASGEAQSLRQDPRTDGESAGDGAAAAETAGNPEAVGVEAAPPPDADAGRGLPSATAIVEPGSLDFGMVPCGTQGASRTVTVRNTGTASFDWTALLARATSFTLSASSGTLPPGGSTSITAIPAPIPSSSSTAADFYADTLTITTTAPNDAPHPLALHETAQGAALSNSSSAIGFGAVPTGVTAAQPFTVTNSGNSRAAVLFATPAPFQAMAQAQIGPSSSYVASVSFTPSSATNFTGSIAMTVSSDTVLCSPLPAALALAGSGTGSQVNVDPPSLDFGLVDCGSQGTAQTLSIRNTGTASFNWTASLISGATYYAVDPSNGSLAAGATASVTVTPVPIATVSAVTADLYAGAVSIATDSPGDAAHVVSLHETARGAVLSWAGGSSTSGIDFGTVAVGSAGSAQVVVANDGNASADVTLTLDNGSNFATAAATGTVPGESSWGTNVTFAPQSTGSHSDVLNLATAAVLCAPLPSAISLTGSGQ